MREYIIGSYLALLLTLFVEVLAAVILKEKSKNGIKHIVLINCVTNPLLNITLAIISSLTSNSAVFIAAVLLLETAVVYAEAFYYKKMLDDLKIGPFLFSFVLNVSSFLAGIIVYFLISNSR